MAKICSNCACEEVCFHAIPSRTEDCRLWQPIIVRCKDCNQAAVRRYEFNGEVYSVFCYRTRERREEDDFCSCGERRGEDG